MFFRTTNEPSRGAAPYNLLAVASEDAPFVATLRQLGQDHPAYQLVFVSNVEEAGRILRRGPVAVLLLSGSPSQAGSLELLVEAWLKDRPPRCIIFRDGVLAGLPSNLSGLRVAHPQLSQEQLERLLAQGCQEFEQMVRCDWSPRDLLAVFALFPDAAWIRFSHESGEIGDLCIRGGRAVYCETGRMTGATALARLLSWKSCRFEYRDFPSFAVSNLNVALSDLGTFPIEPSTEPLAAANAPETPQLYSRPQPIPTDYAARPAANAPTVEEPTEFPVLSQLKTNHLALTSLGPAARTPSPTDPSLDEPEEFPTFSGDPEPEIQVEEPTEILLVEEAANRARVSSFTAGDIPASSDGSDFRPEEPQSLPDFDYTAAPEEQLNSTLFSAVAVCNAHHLVSCHPPDEAAFFEAQGLFELHQLANRYLRQQNEGECDFLLLSNKTATLALTPVAGSENLLVVRFEGRNFGEPERFEMHRLQEILRVRFTAIPV
ncbi:MAG: hypothetical protein NZV14_13025 [Bryobacteraceae bacterium]|nr:hypothetical protein [Bryobacteraceae bacterium]MDW8379078.1 hypothetical protein [Bryobacterales bacterium]